MLPPPPGTDRFPARPDAPSPERIEHPLRIDNDDVADALKDYFDKITK
jgi:hypothetical protein